MLSSSTSRFLLRRRAPSAWLSTLPLNSPTDRGSYEHLRMTRCADIEALPEFRAAIALQTFLSDAAASSKGDCSNTIVPPTPPSQGYKHEMSRHQIRCTIDAMLATFALHVESRIASMLGHGFYTIGPCGEETLASAAWALDDPNDAVALHYRHLGIALARQIHRIPNYDPMSSAGASSSNQLKQTLLDRARGYTASRYDPVTRGMHCSLGSARSLNDTSLGGDFVVTSTLASQCPPAVGRALGYALAPPELLKPNSRPVSFVTIGDGSVHNHHFWSAFHLSRHAKHRNIKCPVVFGISDNGLSISYETRGYVETLFGHDRLVKCFSVNGNDMMDVHSQTTRAVNSSRTLSSPTVILYRNLVRRFGHAATDRQSAYLSESQIQSMATTNILESNLVQAAEVFSAVSYSELVSRWDEIQQLTKEAFVQASQEPKVDRSDALGRVAAPMVAVPRLPPSMLTTTSNGTSPSSTTMTTTTGEKTDVMRKLMARVLEETLERDEAVVYLGEDVRHGGYYVVTEGLASKFSRRVLDFPPDETSLLGAALGLSQGGLLPIVEIPYAKYLDCGADMFYEIAVLHWLTGHSRKNGMIVRLQGFDRGLFGGNFHTTNMLQHVPPGVDVVCFSNGEDYVRGFRNAVLQAKAGRIVVIVDCTHLLNLRHLFDKDRAWERPFPANDDNGLMSFDEIRRFGTSGLIAIVTYGNGVVISLQARRELTDRGIISSESDLDVIDCPCLNRVPSGLSEVIGQYNGVLFADICKEGPGSSVLPSMVVSLQNEGTLPSIWKLVAAPRTYNALGSVSTFLNVSDIMHSLEELKRVIDGNK